MMVYAVSKNNKLYVSVTHVDQFSELFQLQIPNQSKYFLVINAKNKNNVRD